MTSAPVARLGRLADRAISSLLRYDLSRADMMKWVYFARQALMIVLICVVTIAGLSAFLSTKQAQTLLRDSLQGEARAIAGAVARAAFVPLSLEDRDSLIELVDSYKSFEHLASLTVLSPEGRVLYALVQGKPAARPIRVRVPVGGSSAGRRAGARPVQPLGYVEVDMTTRWIDARTRGIAWTNVAVSGTLSLMIFGVGTLVIGNLIERTREMVGEARLVEEVRRANAELESFAYSVAHDLRAPLRAIDGFSQALLAGYSDKVDAEGKDFLNRVRAASARMARIIDDLLNLSRVTRGALNRKPFDLSGLAREIAGQLKSTAPEREVEFEIAAMRPTVGDPDLMRVALENLLSNAWKYTSRHPRARIEVGEARRDGRRVYFVRDDGAGFDMAYAGNLFKPFSRLHTAKEFEGTGIGLATVQRVVERHGGKIWGEAAVEKGATFYFTLGEKA